MLTAVLLFLTTAALAIRVKHGAAASAPTDVLEFVEGVAYGMEVEFAKNITVCVDDETTVLDDFSKGYALIKDGIEHFSTRDVEHGINQLGLGVLSLRDVFTGCGLNSTVEDLDKIAALLRGGVVGWVELIAEEVLNVLEHRQTLGGILRSAVKAYDKGEYKIMGYDTGRFIAILIEDNHEDDDDF